MQRLSGFNTRLDAQESVVAENKTGPEGKSGRQVRIPPPKTPIERIFEEVVGREMTPAERISLHLESEKPRVRSFRSLKAVKK